MGDPENDSCAENEIENVSQLPVLTKLSMDKFLKYPQVSGWEDDDDGVEDSRNPDDQGSKDFLFHAENGNLEMIIKLLIENKHLLSVTDRDGYTALHRASYNNHSKVVEELIIQGADTAALTLDHWQPLHCACKWNSLESAFILIRRGADINAQSVAGVTPLHLAAGNNEAIELVQVLISHPLLIGNIVDKAGDTPLAIAQRSGRNSYLFEILEPCFL